MSELQREVTIWALETFGDNGIAPKALHLFEQLQEVFEAIPGGEYKRYEEVADCVLTLMQLAGTHCIELPPLKDSTLEGVVRAKFEICKNRKWDKPDEHGIVKHIVEARR